MHGGLQKISSKLLAELEFIKVWYARDKVQVIPYKWAWDASETSFVETNVYVFDPEALSADPDNFAEILHLKDISTLKDGADQLGLDPAYVERYLTNPKFVLNLIYILPMELKTYRLTFT